MRIVCPTCSAAYDVPDSLVTAGRSVRCARCGGDWTPVEIAAPEPSPPLEPTVAPAEEPVPVAEPPAAPVVATARPSAMDRLAAHADLPRPSVRLPMAWGASLVLLVLLAGGAYVWRSDVVAAWPPSARAYAAFGLHPQPESPE
jgi:predicted Zn finger-like uncharacterized protein